MGIVKEERIGGQRLILGDCLAVMPLLGRFDHVICDPPYEQISQDRIGGIKRNDGGKVTAKLSFAGIDGIRDALASKTAATCDGWAIFFCTSEGVALWRDQIEAAGLKYKTPMIWVKPDAMPKFNGQGPALGHENIVTAWCGKGHARWNAGGKRGVYTHIVNPSDRDGKHPTEKPWRLMAELLRDFTSPGQTILDPFMGSGTTLVACQRMGRAGTGVELDPDYFDVACRRVDEAARQPDLFIAPKPDAPKQESLL